MSVIFDFINTIIPVEFNRLFIDVMLLYIAYRVTRTDDRLSGAIRRAEADRKKVTGMTYETIKQFNERVRPESEVSKDVDQS